MRAFTSLAYNAAHYPQGRKETVNGAGDGLCVEQGNSGDMITEGTQMMRMEELGVRFEPWMVVQGPCHATRSGVTNGKGNDKARDSRLKSGMENNGSQFHALLMELEEGLKVKQSQTFLNEELEFLDAGVSVLEKAENLLCKSNRLDKQRMVNRLIVKGPKISEKGSALDSKKSIGKESDMGNLIKVKQRLDLGLRESMEVDGETEIRNVLQLALLGELEDHKSQQQGNSIEHKETWKVNMRDDNPYDLVPIARRFQVITMHS